MQKTTSAKLVAQRIVDAAEKRGISVNKLMSAAGVSKSVVDRLKLGTMPSADKIAAIAAILDVPTDYLMGSGVFEKWDIILEHRTLVLSSIANMVSTISSNLGNGVDDLTLARLVSAFSVDIDEGHDPAGLEVLVVSPISISDAPQSAAPQVKKNSPPSDEISENGRLMLEYFEAMTHDEQMLMIGEARGLQLAKGVSRAENAAG